MIILISLSVKYQKRKLYRWGITLIVGTILVGCSGYYISVNSIGLLNAVIIFLLLRVNNSLKLQENIILYTYCLIIIYSIQFFTMFIISAICSGFAYSFTYGVVMQSINLIVTLVLIFTVPFKNIYNYIAYKNNWFRIIVINLFMIYFIMLIIWNTDFNGVLESGLSFLIVVVITIVANTFIVRDGLKSQHLYEKMALRDTI